MTINSNLHLFNRGYNSLANYFAKKYYDSYVEDPLDDTDTFIHPILISDEYWTIEDIWTAIRFDVPKEIVHSWYEYDYQQHLEITAGTKKYRTNFYNFIKDYGNTPNNNKNLS